MNGASTSGVDMHYVLVHGDKHRGMEAFRKAKASALHKLLTVAKCRASVVFCGDEQHARELAQRLSRAGVHATLQDGTAGPELQPDPGVAGEQQNQITFVTSTEGLEAGAESAELVAILDPPPQAAAYLRLLQRLPGRRARGLCVVYVTPLEFIDVKTFVALVPGGKVTPLPDVVQQEHYAHFLYNASPVSAPAPDQAQAGAAAGVEDSSAAGSSATAAELEDTARAHAPELAAPVSCGPAAVAVGSGTRSGAQQGFQASPGETMDTLRELLAARRAQLSTKSALEARAEGASIGAASNPATAGSSEDAATMATAGSATTVEQPARANGHAAAEELAAAEQARSAGEASGVNGMGDAGQSAEVPPPPPPGDPEPAAQPSARPLQPTNLATLDDPLKPDLAPEPGLADPDAANGMSPAARLARLAAAPARLADETPYRDSSAPAEQGPGEGNASVRPRPLVAPDSNHAPVPQWLPETPAGGVLGSCPEAAPSVKQERAWRSSAEAAARKEEQQELLLERAIQAIHQAGAEDDEEGKEKGPPVEEAVVGQGQQEAEAGAWPGYHGEDAAAQWAEWQRQQQGGWWSSAAAAGAWEPSYSSAQDQYAQAWRQWQAGQQQEGAPAAAAAGSSADGQQQQGSSRQQQAEQLVQVPLALLQRYQALEWAEWRREYERWRGTYEEWHAWFSWHSAAAQQQWYSGQHEACGAQDEAPAE